MNFIILWNVHLILKKTIYKTEVHTEPENNNVKKLLTSKNRTELTKLCKLNKSVYVPG
jgi:hypothetical protein